MNFCQLSTVNCQLSTVNCQLSTVNCQLSTVNCQLSTVNFRSQLSTVNCQLSESTVNCQLSTNYAPYYTGFLNEFLSTTFAVNCQQPTAFGINCQLSTVNCQLTTEPFELVRPARLSVPEQPQQGAGGLGLGALREPHQTEFLLARS